MTFVSVGFLWDEKLPQNCGHLDNLQRSVGDIFSCFRTFRCKNEQYSSLTNLFNAQLTNFERFSLFENIGLKRPH